MKKIAYKKEISVIVPTYNEADNIEELVVRINSVLFSAGYKYEIIFIDDKSTDRTISRIKLLEKAYPVKFFIKKGKRGKAYSLVEGFEKAQYENIAIIDADLQYPPEELLPMTEKLKNFDVVVANRKNYKEAFLRRVLSKSFRRIFGKMLFGISEDVQSGLKVFRKKVAESIKFKPSSQWTFDLEFLHRTREAGFSTTSHDISFAKRKKGSSKVESIKTSFEIGSNALKFRFKKIHPVLIPGNGINKMIGAGVGYKRKQFVTHTTLPHQKSAVRTFLPRQKAFIFLMSVLALVGLLLNLMLTLGIIIGFLSLIYFLDTLFNAFLILKSLRQPQEITIGNKEIEKIEEENLPTYTILCPLYKEGHIIPQFVEAISKISWPKDKLDVQLLLEEDDKESINVAKNMSLPSFVRTLVVPHSQPKTKPKACNYGLLHAKGEYLVIYDAEDIPDPLQLKKAYLGFKKAGGKVKCLQAKLNYHNPHQNLLTRFFTAEYSLWFDVTLTGYQSINTTIPLGGTSNHFRTKDLLTLQGWDPFNVTEDADLGVRLFKEGFRTAIIDSTTLEEANSKWGNWVRQRSRWIKGYMQTYLVHTRNPYTFFKTNRQHVFLFNLILGGKIAFILINPFLWLATFSYFALYAYVGPAIERLYPSIVFYMAGFSLIFGNFLYLYYYMIGLMKREQYSLIKYIYLVPFYWLMISFAGFYALYQLILKPHYWEKTVHGLTKTKKPRSVFSLPGIIVTPVRYGMSLFA